MWILWRWADSWSPTMELPDLPKVNHRMQHIQRNTFREWRRNSKTNQICPEDWSISWDMRRIQKRSRTSENEKRMKCEQGKYYMIRWRTDTQSRKRKTYSREIIGRIYRNKLNANDIKYIDMQRALKSHVIIGPNNYLSINVDTILCINNVMAKLFKLVLRMIEFPSCLWKFPW
jgi:hypothetical protein